MDGNSETVFGQLATTTTSPMPTLQPPNPTAGLSDPRVFSSDQCLHSLTLLTVTGWFTTHLPATCLPATFAWGLPTTHTHCTLHSGATCALFETDMHGKMIKTACLLTPSSRSVLPMEKHAFLPHPPDRQETRWNRQAVWVELWTVWVWNFLPSWLDPSPLGQGSGDRLLPVAAMCMTMTPFLRRNSPLLYAIPM